MRTIYVKSDRLYLKKVLHTRTCFDFIYHVLDGKYHQIFLNERLGSSNFFTSRKEINLIDNLIISFGGNLQSFNAQPYGQSVDFVLYHIKQNFYLKK